MPRRGLLSLPLATLTGACAAQVAEYKYKLTYRFRVNGELKEGAGVIENRWVDNSVPVFGRMAGPPFRCETTGEAVPIDLGDSLGSVFALLTRIPDDPNYHWSMPLRVLEGRVPQEDRARAREGQIYGLISRVEGEVAIPGSDLPTFVRFRDLGDPRSVERISPAAFSANGTEASLVGASIEVTGDPVTSRINELLPWLRSTDNFLSGARSGAGSRESFFAGLTKPMFERRGF